MNVRELIEELQQYDPEVMVVINGYEGGYAEIKKMTEVDLMLGVNKEWYYGSHEITTTEEGDCKAILIG